MTIPDPRTLAAALKRAADRADVEHGPAVDRSRDWKTGIPANAGDGIRAKGGHGDPTLARVLARTDHAAGIHHRLETASWGMLKAVEVYLSCLDDCKPTRTERAEANDLESVNGRAGICFVCDKAGLPDLHDHKGTPDDRLKGVVTGERVEGVLVEAKLCEGCYKAWRRRPYSETVPGVFQEYEVWEVHRVEHLRAVQAASNGEAA